MTRNVETQGYRIRIERLLEEALASAEPLREIRGVVRGLLAAGHERDTILEDLERFRFALRAAGRDADEDVVLDVMDFVVGWCSPQMRL